MPQSCGTCRRNRPSWSELRLGNLQVHCESGAHLLGDQQVVNGPLPIRRHTFLTVCPIWLVAYGSHELEENSNGAASNEKSQGCSGCCYDFRLVLTGCASEGGSGSKSDTIRVGLIAALSGPAAAFGGPQQASMAAAVDRINNAGGVELDGKTYKFELKSYDHAYDPTKAVTAANQAITKDDISFLQVDGGSIVPAVQPIAEKRDVMVMALAGGDQYLGEKHPTTFRLYYDISRSFGASLSYIKSKDPKVQKVLGIFTDDEVGRVIAEQSDGIAKSLDVTPSSVFVSRDATDFAPVLNQVLPKRPNVIQFGGMPPSQYAGIVKTARSWAMRVPSFSRTPSTCRPSSTPRVRKVLREASLRRSSEPSQARKASTGPSILRTTRAATLHRLERSGVRQPLPAEGGY